MKTEMFRSTRRRLLVTMLAFVAGVFSIEGEASPIALNNTNFGYYGGADFTYDAPTDTLNISGNGATLGTDGWGTATLNRNFVPADLFSFSVDFSDFQSASPGPQASAGFHWGSGGAKISRSGGANGAYTAFTYGDAGNTSIDLGSTTSLAGKFIVAKTADSVSVQVDGEPSTAWEFANLTFGSQIGIELDAHHDAQVSYSNFDLTTDPGPPLPGATIIATGDVSPDPTSVGDKDLSGQVLDVGFAGPGSVSVTSGSTLTTQYGNIGGLANGLMTVDGATWNNTDQVNIGSLSGSADGEVVVINGAHGSSGLDTYLGFAAGTQGTLTVDNGSWDAGQRLWVGSHGTGGIDVRNSGSLTSHATDIGGDSGSSGTVTIDNSTWMDSRWITVGVRGQGTLNVQDNGSVTTDSVGVSKYDGSQGTVNVKTGGLLHVNGGDPATFSSGIGVGNSPHGPGLNGTLNVSSGGRVLIDGPGAYPYMLIGGITSANRGSVDLSGVGSSIALRGDEPVVAVGRNGVGTMLINDGGALRLESTSLYPSYLDVARLNGSTGSLIITGADSTLEMSSVGSFSVARIGGREAGTNASVRIANGGSFRVLDADGLVAVARRPGSSATVTVTGAGSELDAGGLLLIGKEYGWTGDPTTTRWPTGDWDFLTPPQVLGDGGSGTVTVNAGGVIRAATIEIGAPGTLAGDQGAVIGNVHNLGTIAPGNSPGTLTIDGDLNFDDGVLEIQIAGAGVGDYDVLHVTGDAAFTGGTIRFDFLNGYLPGPADLFDFLQVDGALTRLDATYAVTGLPSGYGYTVSGTGSGLRLSASTNVPEPATVVLLGLGIIGLLMFYRRQDHIEVNGQGIARR